MNGTTTTETLQHHTARETALKLVAGGSIMEAVGAIAAIALAIVGLAGVFSTTMASIATIVIGAAILIEAGAFGSAQFASRAGAGAMSGGMSAEFLGGLAGIVLGILSLLGVASLTLLSVAVLVFGASFLLSGGSASQLGWTANDYRYGSQGETVARQAAVTNSGGQVMVGLAGIVLGILAVIGIAPLTLVLVGLLSLGAAALFSGSSTSAHAVPAASR